MFNKMLVGNFVVQLSLTAKNQWVHGRSRLVLCMCEGGVVWVDRTSL